jgi:hypothetical protein
LGTGSIYPDTQKPNEIAGSNLKLWLDAADSSTLFSEHTFNTSATTTVGGWKDKSGNNNHATRATSSKRPTYTVSNSLLNNKSSVSSASQNGSIGLDLPAYPFRRSLWSPIIKMVQKFI